MAREPFNPDRVKAPREEPLFGSPGKDAPLTVSQLTGMIKRALAALPVRLCVAGEVSNFTQSPNGHLYFTLKDEGSCVDCVMWRSDVARMKFRLSDGLAVLAFGQVDVYEPRGRYQLYVNRLLPQGKGELELAFRQLHEKLSKLGWFDAGRKRPIPRIPRTIGVVTSRTGAAIRDILRTLSLRWPVARVVVIDTRVQGEGSAEAIASAIGRMNRHAAALGGIDVMIVGRGGGSLEDLWSFNTEIVARAILDSAIPIVSGVGHEVDTTIADLVADLRAATPTAAAQAVVSDRREIANHLDDSFRVLFGAVRRKLSELSQRVAACSRSEMFRRPASMLRVRRQQLDELAGRLVAGERELLHRANRAVGELARRLGAQHPRAMLLARWRRVESAVSRMRWALGKITIACERLLSDRAAALRRISPVAGPGQRVETLERQLAAYDPRAVLRRGYSMTTIKSTGELLTRPEQVRLGERLVTELSAGRVESDVADAAGAPPATRRVRRGAAATDEPGLFNHGATDGEERQG
ncbi:MAG: exodeoxyribonuclease VII large subunit [Phycisphaerae bacterium]|nr:exodeoxyribonuclease VII large subunit [Phycisphaerae bacterium]